MGRPLSGPTQQWLHRPRQVRRACDRVRPVHRAAAQKSGLRGDGAYSLCWRYHVGIKETETKSGWIVISDVGGLGQLAIEYAKARGLHVGCQGDGEREIA